MALVDLATAKRHLRVLHSDDDAEIELYTSAAEDIVVEYLDRVVLPEGETLPADDDTAMHVKPSIVAAILLMLGDLYENREADREQKSDAVMPPSVRALLAPWRVWRLVPEETTA
ncbi:head-tail connector protein [Sinorhizobium meliloti]|uniref:head-tail connector protein n=1 Tax=Rhizobium meliloti TaxID=382 RepID=UPI000FDA3734|nr:head-tail connector protein [Sinorhizobium meliloti]MDX0014789.1 phage gp6-like head-tail connector protein [Sinorhizobium meliloti]MDX0304181.1 phage gp6-like head-tail connector protein [Sinorhizobium meliloti]RVI86420.1 phage gp6-like head-tail connector protein [Sinorhizobium meliloti]